MEKDAAGPVKKYVEEMVSCSEKSVKKRICQERKACGSFLEKSTNFL